jgi:hypothetical protein
MVCAHTVRKLKPGTFEQFPAAVAAPRDLCHTPLAQVGVT